MTEQRVSMIMPEHLGKEVQFSQWNRSWWKKVTAVGEIYFLAGDIQSECTYIREGGWLVRDPEPTELKPSEWIARRIGVARDDVQYAEAEQAAIIEFLDEQHEKKKNEK